MSGAVLRKPTILPLFNVYTVAGLIAIAYLTVSVYLRLLWGADSGIEYLYYLMLIQLTPVMVAFTRRHFTYISFIMIFHFFQLSLPKWFLLQEDPLLMVNAPEMLLAIKEQIFCTSIIILVYYACRNLLFSAVSEKERFQLLTLSRLQVYFLAAYVLFIPMFLDRFPAWFLSLHFLLLSADVVLLFTSNSPGNEWLMRFTKTAALLGAFNYFLKYGMMTLMGALVSLGALVSCLKKQYKVLSVIVLGVLLMSAIQTVKGPFRVIINSEVGESLPTWDRLLVLGELLGAKYLDDEDTELFDEEDDKKDESLGSGLISGFMRAGDDSLERVLAMTPSKVPFWKGETYESIPFMFIPRALWPDKPSRHFWNKYGRVYGILDTEDYQTSVGVSYLAEAYMNFGFSGMYLIAVLMGLLFSVVERSAFYILNGYFYFPYIVLLTPLLMPGTDLGSMVNSLWVIYLVFLLGRPVLTRMAQRDEYS